MISFETSKILSAWVAEQVSVLPKGWNRHIAYREFLRDADGYLRNIGMDVLWINGREFNDEPVPTTAEALRLMERFFDLCVLEGDVWSAIRIDVSASGQFHTQFWYDSWPLLNEDYVAADVRIGA